MEIKYKYLRTVSAVTAFIHCVTGFVGRSLKAQCVGALIEIMRVESQIGGISRQELILKLSDNLTRLITFNILTFSLSKSNAPRLMSDSRCRGADEML